MRVFCFRFGGWLSVSFDNRLEERLRDIQIIHLQLQILNEGHFTFQTKVGFLVLVLFFNYSVNITDRF